MKVEVYKNLHQNCWSVRNNKTGRVIDYVDSIHIEDATLVVRPAGRARVLKEHKKNVHAFIKGTINNVLYKRVRGLRQITYDPYKYSSFIVSDTKEPVHTATNVFFTSNGKVYVEDNND